MRGAPKYSSRPRPQRDKIEMTSVKCSGALIASKLRHYDPSDGRGFTLEIGNNPRKKGGSDVCFYGPGRGSGLVGRREIGLPFDP